MASEITMKSVKNTPVGGWIGLRATSGKWMIQASRTVEAKTTKICDRITCQVRIILETNIKVSCRAL